MGASALTPAITAATIMRVLEDNLMAKKICNTDYSGEIKQKGDRVIFPGLEDVSIGNYTGAGITYDPSTSADLTMLIDQQKYYAFAVTDIEQAQDMLSKKNSQIKNAAYQMAREVDKYVFGLYAQAAANAAAITDATCDDDTILGDIALLGRYLDENNVPDGQRWLVIPPWVKMHLILAGVQFQVNNGTNGTGGMEFAKEFGFDIFVSNNLNNSGTAAAPVHSVLAGSYNAIGFADQVTKNEVLRSPTLFQDNCRGLYTFGAKVLKPKELALATLTYSAPTL